MATTWSARMDWDSPTPFGEERITQVVSMEWSLGMEPFASMESETFARIVLDNRDGLLDDDLVASDFAAGKEVRIVSNDGMSREMFTGRIHHVEQDKTGFLTVVCETAMAQLAQEVNIALAVNVDVDDAIGAILDQCQLRYANVGAVFFLDYSLLDSTTELLAIDSGSAIMRFLGMANTNLAYVGDTYEGGVLAAHAIRDLVEAEGGRFYVDRYGRFVFKSRSELYFDQTPTLVFGGANIAVSDCRYVQGKYFVSQEDIEVTPRSVGAAGSVLWQLDDAMRFDANSEREFRLVYRDSNDRMVGSLVAGERVGWSFNTASDGSGTDVTSSVTVAEVKTDASSVLVTVRHDLPYMVYLLVGARVVGTPLLQDDPVVVSTAAVYNSFQFVKRVERKRLEVLTSVIDAQNLAAFDVARRAQMFEFFDEIVVDDELSGTTAALAAGVFFYGGVTVGGLVAGAGDRDYVITRETHKVSSMSGGEGRHEARYQLEPKFGYFFFRLDQSVLDGATVLGY
jgi:hypothetical protein